MVHQCSYAYSRAEYSAPHLFVKFQSLRDKNINWGFPSNRKQDHIFHIKRMSSSLQTKNAFWEIVPNPMSTFYKCVPFLQSTNCKQEKILTIQSGGNKNLPTFFLFTNKPPQRKLQNQTAATPENQSSVRGDESHIFLKKKKKKPYYCNTDFPVLCSSK